MPEETAGEPAAVHQSGVLEGAGEETRGDVTPANVPLRREHAAAAAPSTRVAAAEAAHLRQQAVGREKKEASRSLKRPPSAAKSERSPKRPALSSMGINGKTSTGRKGA